MKLSSRTSKILILALATFAVGQNLKAEQPHSEQGRRETIVGIKNVFVPVSFNNTEPSAELSGVFPNGCYFWKRADVKQVAPALHEVRVIANVKTNLPCTMALIPYIKEVALGKLPQGRHTLRFMQNKELYIEKQIVIE